MDISGSNSGKNIVGDMNVVYCDSETQTDLSFIRSKKMIDNMNAGINSSGQVSKEHSDSVALSDKTVASEKITKKSSETGIIRVEGIINIPDVWSTETLRKESRRGRFLTCVGSEIIDVQKAKVYMFMKPMIEADSLETLEITKSKKSLLEIGSRENVDVQKSIESEVGVTEILDVQNSKESEVGVTEILDVQKSKESEVGVTEILDVQKSKESGVGVTEILDVQKSKEAEVGVTEILDVQKSKEAEVGVTEILDVQKSKESEVGITETLDVQNSKESEVGMTENLDDQKSIESEVGMTENLDDQKSNELEVGMTENLDDQKLIESEVGMTENLNDQKSNESEVGMTENLDDQKLIESEVGMTENLNDQKSNELEVGMTENQDVQKSNESEVVMTENQDVQKSNESEVGMTENLDIQKSQHSTLGVGSTEILEVQESKQLNVENTDIVNVQKSQHSTLEVGNTQNMDIEESSEVVYHVLREGSKIEITEGPGPTGPKYNIVVISTFLPKKKKPLVSHIRRPQTPFSERFSLLKGKKYVGKTWVTLHKKLNKRYKRKEIHKQYLFGKNIIEQQSINPPLLLLQARVQVLIANLHDKLFARSLLSLCNEIEDESSLEQIPELLKGFVKSKLEIKAINDWKPVHVFVQKLIEEHSAVVFFFSTCFTCLKLLKLFRDYELEHIALRIDLMGGYGEKIMDYFKTEYSNVIPPNIYYHGMHFAFFRTCFSLVDELVPVDEIVGLSPDAYDLIVFGNTPVGLEVVLEARRIGVKTCLIDCPVRESFQPLTVFGNPALTDPGVSKKLLYYVLSLRKIANKQTGPRTMDTVKKINYNWKYLMHSAQSLMIKINYDNKIALQRAGASYFNCMSKFIEPQNVELTNSIGTIFRLRSSFFVISTPMQHKMPNIKGSRHCIYPDQLFTLARSPGKTLIYGASREAIEYAGLLSSIGFPVTIITPSSIMADFDTEMVKIIIDNMKIYGVSIINDCIVERVRSKQADEVKRRKVVLNPSPSNESLYRFIWNPLTAKPKAFKKTKYRRPFRGRIDRAFDLDKVIRNALMSCVAPEKVFDNILHVEQEMKIIKGNQGASRKKIVKGSKMKKGSTKKRKNQRRSHTKSSKPKGKNKKMDNTTMKDGKERPLSIGKLKRKLKLKLIAFFLSTTRDEKIKGIIELKNLKKQLFKLELRRKNNLNNGPFYSERPRKIGVYFPGNTAFRLPLKSRYFRPVHSYGGTRTLNVGPFSVQCPTKEILTCIKNLKRRVDVTGLHACCLKDIPFEDLERKSIDDILEDFHKEDYRIKHKFRISLQLSSSFCFRGYRYEREHQCFEEYIVYSLRNIDKSIKMLGLMGPKTNLETQGVRVLKFLARFSLSLQTFSLYITWRTDISKENIKSAKERFRDRTKALQYTNENFLIQIKCKIIQISILDVLNNLGSLFTFVFLSACHDIAETHSDRDLRNENAYVSNCRLRLNKIRLALLSEKQDTINRRKNKIIKRSKHPKIKKRKRGKHYKRINRKRRTKNKASDCVKTFDTPQTENPLSGIGVKGNADSPYENNVQPECYKTEIKNSPVEQEGPIDLATYLRYLLSENAEISGIQALQKRLRDYRNNQDPITMVSEWPLEINDLSNDTQILKSQPEINYPSEDIEISASQPKINDFRDDSEISKDQLTTHEEPSRTNSWNSIKNSNPIELKSSFSKEICDTCSSDIKMPEDHENYNNVPENKPVKKRVRFSPETLNNEVLKRKTISVIELLKALSLQNLVTDYKNIKETGKISGPQPEINDLSDDKNRLTTHEVSSKSNLWDIFEISGSESLQSQDLEYSTCTNTQPITSVTPQKTNKIKHKVLYINNKKRQRIQERIRPKRKLLKFKVLKSKTMIIPPTGVTKDPATPEVKETISEMVVIWDKELEEKRKKFEKKPIFRSKINKLIDEHILKTKKPKKQEMKCNFRNFVKVNFGIICDLRPSITIRRTKFFKRFIDQIDAKAKIIRPIKIISVESYKKRVRRDRNKYLEHIISELYPPSNLYLYEFLDTSVSECFEIFQELLDMEEVERPVCTPDPRDEILRKLMTKRLAEEEVGTNKIFDFDSIFSEVTGKKSVTFDLPSSSNSDSSSSFHLNWCFNQMPEPDSSNSSLALRRLFESSSSSLGLRSLFGCESWESSELSSSNSDFTFGMRRMFKEPSESSDSSELFSNSSFALRRLFNESSENSERLELASCNSFSIGQVMSSDETYEFINTAAFSTSSSSPGWLFKQSSESMKVFEPNETKESESIIHKGNDDVFHTSDCLSEATNVVEEPILLGETNKYPIKHKLKSRKKTKKLKIPKIKGPDPNCLFEYSNTELCGTLAEEYEEYNINNSMKDVDDNRNPTSNSNVIRKSSKKHPCGNERKKRENRNIYTKTITLNQLRIRMDRNRPIKIPHESFNMRCRRHHGECILKQLFSDKSKRTTHFGMMPLDGRSQLEHQLKRKLKKIHQQTKAFSKLLEELKQYIILKKIVKLLESKKSDPDITAPRARDERLFPGHPIYRVSGKYTKPEQGRYRGSFNTIIVAGNELCPLQNINLEEIGVKTHNNGKIYTNVLDQTTVPHIFALGECVFAWTYEKDSSVAASQCLIRRIFMDSTAEITYHIATKVLQTYPHQYACLGLNTEQATELYDNVVTYTGSFTSLNNELMLTANVPSTLKFVCNEESPGMERIIGIHFYNDDAYAVIQGYTSAMKMGMYYKEVEDLIVVCPTTSEFIAEIKMERKEYKNERSQEPKNIHEEMEDSISECGSISPLLLKTIVECPKKEEKMYDTIDTDSMDKQLSEHSENSDYLLSFENEEDFSEYEYEDEIDEEDYLLEIEDEMEDIVNTENIEPLGENMENMEPLGENMEPLGEDMENMEPLLEDMENTEPLGEDMENVDPQEEENINLQEVDIENIDSPEVDLENIELQEEGMENIDSHDEDMGNIEPQGENMENIEPHDGVMENIETHRDDMENIESLEEDTEDFVSLEEDIENIVSLEEDMENIESHGDDLENIESNNENMENIESQGENMENIESHGDDMENIESNNENMENTETHRDDLENIESLEEDMENIESNNENMENIESNNENMENIESNNENMENIESNNENMENIESRGDDMENIEAHNENMENIESQGDNIENIESQHFEATENYSDQNSEESETNREILPETSNEIDNLDGNTSEISNPSTVSNDQSINFKKVYKQLRDVVVTYEMRQLHNVESKEAVYNAIKNVILENEYRRFHSTPHRLDIFPKKLNFDIKKLGLPSKKLDSALKSVRATKRKLRRVIKELSKSS